MARPTPSSSHRVFRRWSVSATVLVICAALVTTGLSLPASADISQQIKASQAELDRLQSQAEAAAERYNAGRITVAKATQRAEVAQVALVRQDAVVSRLRGQAGVFAAQVYRSGAGGLDVTVLSSTAGPSNLLDRLGTLDRVARGQTEVMQSLSVARHQQAGAAAEAHAAVGDATYALAGLRRDKAEVEQAATRAQAILRDLQVKQAAIIKAAKDAADRRAAQARAAQLQAQADANAQALAAFANQQVQVVAVRASRSTASRDGSGRNTAPAPAPQPAPAPVQQSGNAAQVAVSTAMAQLGKPYVWGAEGPNSFDCSGLTMFAYAAAGVSLPHYTGAQINVGRRVSWDEMQPGDLIFFGSDLHHMGMYIGGGQMIHAPHTGDVVKISSLSGYYQSTYAGSVRVVG